MDQKVRNYRLCGQDVPAPVLDALHDLHGWPAYTRYVVCSIDGDGGFRAYVEFSVPVRPTAFRCLPDLRLETRTSVSRDEHRAAVLGAAGVVETWTVGSWEAGLPGRRLGSRNAVVQQQTSAEVARIQNELVATQQQLIATLLQQQGGAGAPHASYVSNVHNIHYNSSA